MHEVGRTHNEARQRFLAGAGIAAGGLAFSPLLRSSSPRTAVSRDVPLVHAAPAPDMAMPRLYPRAMAALDRHSRAIVHLDVVAVVDFSQPSRDPRMHVIDPAAGKVSSFLVSHGSGSDPNRSGWLQRFSNVPDSNASSRGAYLTGEEYVGKHGRSRRLIGLDPDNSLAQARAIVLHGASYVNARMAEDQGLIGRSQGCFALAEAAIDDVLARLGPGRLLFAWK